MIAEIVKVKVIGQNFSYIYRVSNFYDRVCIDYRNTRYTVHDTRRFCVSCTELWFTYRCTLYFTDVRVLCTNVHVTKLKLHVLVFIYDSCIGNSTVPTQPRGNFYRYVFVRHYD